MKNLKIKPLSMAVVVCAILSTVALSVYAERKFKANPETSEAGFANLYQAMKSGDGETVSKINQISAMTKDDIDKVIAIDKESGTIIDKTKGNKVVAVYDKQNGEVTGYPGQEDIIYYQALINRRNDLENQDISNNNFSKQENSQADFATLFEQKGKIAGCATDVLTKIINDTTKGVLALEAVLTETVTGFFESFRTKFTTSEKTQLMTNTSEIQDVIKKYADVKQDDVIESETEKKKMSQQDKKTNISEIAVSGISSAITLWTVNLLQSAVPEDSLITHNWSSHSSFVKENK